MKKLLNKTTKVCCRCSIEKPLDDFHKETKGSSGRQGKCKSCNTISRREYSSRTPDANWKMNLRRMGLTPEEYKEIHTAQGGVCACCGGLEKNIDKRTGKIRRLAVDHDHSCCPDRTACKKCIRGLLCQSCNYALGLLNDDLGRIASLARYLEK